MKFGVMWRDVSESLFSRPVTEHYPVERHAAPANLRGLLDFDPAKCTGCGMCVKDCPASAIDLVVLDKKAKRYVFTYHIDRCTFCAQCRESCQHGCIVLKNDQWELAALGPEGFAVHFGDEADVQQVLSSMASSPA
jgi:formate hydrogenlyase subunit 6/NADH:ubiquinone oxidoreductase subunit I